jgi:hypothetical protein
MKSRRALPARDCPPVALPLSCGETGLRENAMARNGSFEKFYFEKVALGESCGCAEQVIATRDLDDRARPAEDCDAEARAPLRDRLARLFARPRP